MNIQRWRPDTCECVVDEAVQADGAKTLHKVVRKCTVHGKVADDALYDVLYAGPYGENKRKNMLLARLAEHPDLGEDVVDPESGASARTIRSNVHINWHFTGEGTDRVLHVSSPRRAGRRVSVSSTPLKGIVENNSLGPVVFDED